MKKVTLCLTMFGLAILLAGCQHMFPELPASINGIPTNQLTVEQVKEMHLEHPFSDFLPDHFDREDMKALLKKHYQGQVSADVIDYLVDVAAQDKTN